MYDKDCFENQFFTVFNFFTGKSATTKVRSHPADEHLSAAGDRQDAASDQRCQDDAARPEAGDRRNDHHEREPSRRSGSDVRRAHTPAVEKGKNLSENVNINEN